MDDSRIQFPRNLGGGEWTIAETAFYILFAIGMILAAPLCDIVADWVPLGELLATLPQ